MTTQTEEQTTNQLTLEKLQAQVIEMRARQRIALDASDDSKVRKLSNELAKVNAEILDFEANAQVKDRTAYTAAMDEAISKFEVPGLALTVSFETGDDGDKWTIAYMVSDQIIKSIKDAALLVTRPSSVTKYKYYTDEKGARQFDLGKSSGRNGTRVAGWNDKDGNTVQLGVAFDTIATSAQKKEMAAMDTASKQNAFKATTVTANGYTKKSV